MSKASFQFEISTVKPTAAVFVEPFLEKTIVRLLHRRGLNISKKLKAVSYVVDSEGNAEAIKLSQEKRIKYLRLIIDNSPSPHFENLNWRIIKTGTLIGPEISKNSPWSQLIISAIKNEPLILPVLPKNKIYFLHPNDLAEAIWQVLVLPGTSGKEFTIAGQMTTADDLANFLQSLGQTTKGRQFFPELTPANFSPEQIESSCQQLQWQPKISWQKAIEETFHYFWKKRGSLTSVRPSKVKREIEKPVLPKKTKPPEEKEEVIIVEEKPKEDLEELKIKKIIADFGKTIPLKKEKIKPSTKRKGLSPTKILILTVALAFLLEISIWLKPIIALGFGWHHLKQSFSQLKMQSWSKSKTSAGKAKKCFEQSEELTKNHWSKAFLFCFNGDLAKLSEIGRKSAAAAETAIPLGENYLALIETILKDGNFDFATGISKIANQQKELSSQLSIIEALLSSSWQNLPPRWHALPQQANQKIKRLRLALNNSEKLLAHFPWLVGANNQRRTFLILLQNNMELRPTGGFIGSFALLSFEDGSLTNFEVKDVYLADGQLKGHVEPPKQIKEVLGEESWYLRDANWSPDFSKTAKNTEWFLKKELGREVDGVFGFNLEAAKKLIAAFGEIYLPDFNEKINANNLFERTEFWSEKEFFPGSTQKMAFLGLLGKQLFENIKAARPEEYLKIGRAVLESLEEKEILVYTHQPQLTATLHQLNWDGAIKKPLCHLDFCFSDYLFLVEANLGVNKANYFLRRSLEQSIKFQKDGQIIHNLKINYENTAVSDAWPGGNYVNWLRIYLPSQTKIEEIIIYDPLNPQEKTIVDPRQREEEIKNGKEIIGFLVRVPIKQRRTIEIKFNQKTEVGGESLGYLLYWQKQSGYQSTPVSLLVSFPQDWQPIQVDPAASLVSGKLLFNQQLDKDLKFGVEFGK